MPSIAIPNLDREVFETVVKSIYNDPRRASLREIIANAIDANRERFGDPAQSQVTVCFDIDYIAIQDQGIGISPKVMKDIYGAMFKTTKRSGFADTVTDSNGEHGIGSKTPYGLLYDAEGTSDLIANYYIVNTVYEGVRYVYKMYLSKEGIPSYDLIHEETTDRDSGTQVSFPNFFKPSNMYSNVASLTLESGQTKLLWEVLTPFIDGNHTEVPLLFNGDNYAVMRIVTQIIEATKNVVVAGPIRHYSMPETDDILVKYKNILYPVKMFDFRHSLRDAHDLLTETTDLLPDNRDDVVDMICAIAAKHMTVFEIDLTQISAPLKVNRSRDRFEFDTNTSEAMAALAKQVMLQAYNVVDAGCRTLTHIVETSQNKDMIKKNSLIESLKGCRVIRSGLVLGDPNSIMSALQDLFVSSTDGFDGAVIEGVDYRELVDIMFTYGDVSAMLKNFMVRDIQQDRCDLIDNLNAILSDSSKRVTHCTMDNVRSGRKFSSNNASGSLQASFKTLCGPELAILIRDTKSYTVMAESLLKSTDHDYTRVIVLSAKDIDKKAFDEIGYTHAYNTSELVEENSEVIEQIQQVQKARAARIKGIRHVLTIDSSFDSDVIKRNQKSLEPKVLESLLSGYEGRVFYSFDVPMTADFATTEDGQRVYIEKTSDKHRDPYKFTHTGDVLYSGDIHSALPARSLLFYLESSSKQDFTQITDVATDLDSYVKQWFAGLTMMDESGVNKSEDVKIAVRTMGIANPDSHTVAMVSRFINGALNHAYFDDTVAEANIGAVKNERSPRQEIFRKRFVKKAHNPKAQEFVEEIQRGFEHNPTILFIVEQFPRFVVDDEKFQKYVDFILSQLAVEKF